MKYLCSGAGYRRGPLFDVKVFLKSPSLYACWREREIRRCLGECGMVFSQGKCVVKSFHVGFCG